MKNLEDIIGTKIKEYEDLKKNYLYRIRSQTLTWEVISVVQEFAWGHIDMIDIQSDLHDDDMTHEWMLDESGFAETNVFEIGYKSDYPEYFI